MNQPLTDQQLDEIEARRAAATKGPWLTTHAGTDENIPVVYVNRTSPKGVAYSSVLWQADWATDADGEFTAHAPQDVAALLAEVHRLRAELERRTEDLASADNPTPLRWGLNDVLYGDDDTTTVLLSGPAGEPYWLELDPERAAVLRDDLAGPVRESEDTLPAWLHQRFAVIHGVPTWDRIDDGDRAYWERHARAVRRAVARGGFKGAASVAAVSSAAENGDQP